MIEIIALVVAICAFIVSVAVPIFEFLWNQKMNTHNLKAEYFRDVYGEILYQDIPMALEYIHFDGQVVSGTEELCKILRKIRVRSIYFKVADTIFFNKLKDAVQDLEDYIVNSSEEMSSAQFVSFYEVVNEKIELIYKHMSNEYIGVKKNKS